MSVEDKPSDPKPVNTSRGLTLSSRVWMEARYSPWFIIGGLITVIILASAIIVPEVSELSAQKINIGARYLPPVFLAGGTWDHILGTDQLGRDILLRCLVGLRASFLIAVLSVIIMFVIGCAVGLWSGFKSGWTDLILMRLTDVQLSIPAIILAIAILGISRPSIPTIVIVLALAGWPTYARVVRSIALNERNREFVRAARVIGASDLRIVVLLIAANVVPSVAFVAILDIARMMIFEAMLSFIGLGIQPPTPSFGTMIADGRKYMFNAWWISSMPGVFLFVLVLSLNFIGISFERAREKVFGGRA